MSDTTPIRFGPLTRCLVRRWGTPPGDGPRPVEIRSAYGVLEGWVSVVVNTLLFAIKLVLGLLTGSIALMADAAHTLSDSVTSAIVIVGARMSRRPPDAEHPYGHGRAEAIATLAIAMLLAVAGVEFGKASIERVWSPSPVTAPPWAMATLIVTMVIKEWLSRFALALSRATGNQSLEADAWHHRSDVFATGLVVVGMVAGSYGLTWLDGVMGIGVSVLLVKIGFDVIRGAIDTLLGGRPSPEEVREVHRLAREVDGVRGVHDVVIHRYGDLRFVSLHVETRDDLTALALHDIAERVEARVATDGHGSVSVHVDPINTDHPAYASLEALLRRAVAADPDLAAFHDLRVVGEGERFNVVFDLNVLPGCLDPERARARLVEAIRREHPGARVVAEIDPPYAY